LIYHNNFKQDYIVKELDNSLIHYNIEPTIYTNFEISKYVALFDNNMLKFVKPILNAKLYYIKNFINYMECFIETNNFIYIKCLNNFYKTQADHIIFDKNYILIDGKKIDDVLLSIDFNLNKVNYIKNRSLLQDLKRISNQ